MLELDISIIVRYSVQCKKISYKGLFIESSIYVHWSPLSIN